jgi:hypothetical protein
MKSSTGTGSYRCAAQEANRSSGTLQAFLAVEVGLPRPFMGLRFPALPVLPAPEWSSHRRSMRAEGDRGRVAYQLTGTRSGPTM